MLNQGKSVDQVRDAALADVKKNKYTDQQKIDKYPNLYYWEYVATQSEQENQNKLNSAAQTKYEASADGTDDTKELLYEG